MKIGIYGGSFNPIHFGHIGLAKWVIENTDLDELWLMVSPNNPLKDTSILADEQERLAAAQEAVKDIPGVVVSDFEFALPRPNYTANTLRALAQAYPEHEFTLIIGEDNWNHFDRWYRKEDIVRETPIIVYPRDSVEGIVLRIEGKPLIPSTKHSSLNTMHSTLKLFPYSSTEVRHAIVKGWDIRAMLHPDVEAYIQKNNLYK